MIWLSSSRYTAKHLLEMIDTLVILVLTMLFKVFERENSRNIAYGEFCALGVLEIESFRSFIDTLSNPPGNQIRSLP